VYHTWVGSKFQKYVSIDQLLANHALEASKYCICDVMEMGSMSIIDCHLDPNCLMNVKNFLGEL
jgi:hypothetical protein